MEQTRSTINVSYTPGAIGNVIKRTGKHGQGLEPDEGQLSRPVVCPAKADVFSRRQTYQGKSQSPVARSAGGRETNSLKPLDSPICGMGASFQAVA